MKSASGLSCEAAKSRKCSACSSSSLREGREAEEDEESGVERNSCVKISLA